MKKIIPFFIIILLITGCSNQQITGNVVKQGMEQITGNVVKQDLTTKEDNLTNPIKNPRIIEQTAFIDKEHISYFYLNVGSPTEVDYEIESIKNPEIGVNSAPSVYLHFLRPEDNILEFDKVDFGYKCTPKIQVRKAKGNCAINKGAGFMLRNSHPNKDALVKLRLIIYD